jgi:hypothetical protein
MEAVMTRLIHVFTCLVLVFSLFPRTSTIPATSAQSIQGLKKSNIPGFLASGSVIRIMPKADGSQTNVDIRFAALSKDGRYIVFETDESLLEEDIYPQYDIYLYDVQTRETKWITDDTVRSQWGYIASFFFPSISDDGRYLAFVRNQNGDTYRVLVLDRLTNTIILVSKSSSGELANGSSSGPQISGNGRFVAFFSDANNLVPNDTNSKVDDFIYDLQTSLISRVSVSTYGEQGNDHSGITKASISQDGRYVVFSSAAKNLVVNDNDDNDDVFIHDRLTGTTLSPSISDDGNSGFGSNSSISADGRYVAFHSNENLPGGAQSPFSQVIIYDQVTGNRTLASVSQTGELGDVGGAYPAISSEGRYVAFNSGSSNLVDGDNNGLADVFVKDRVTGEVQLVSLSTDGTQGNASVDVFTLAISGDGNAVLFVSPASNLVPGDTNGKYDLFLWQRGVIPPTDKPDLSIASINPIQVVEHPDVNSDGRWDYVLGKPMVVRVKVTIQTPELIPPDKASGIRVILQFQGAQYSLYKSITEMQQNPVDFYVTPNIVGNFAITAIVDANNQIPESDENNNQPPLPSHISIKETQDLKFVYIPINFPQAPSSYQDTVANSTKFIKATYPINPSMVNDKRIDALVDLPPAAKIPNDTGLKFAYLNFLLNGKYYYPLAHRVVAVVPEGFFAYYGKPLTKGFTLGDNAMVAVVTDGFYTVAAHELGHTFGLWAQDPAKEEYNVFPPYGRAANGFWVQENKPIENSHCFMGASDKKYEFAQWIDTDDFNQLFARRRINPADPEILLVTGSISKDGIAEFYKFYRIAEGVPDETQGNYELQVVDIKGDLLYSINFDASFYFFGIEGELSEAPFAFAIPYPDQTITIRIIKDGNVLGQINSLGKLLDDMIESIPDAGFVDSPSTRRIELHSKVAQFISQLTMENVSEGINLVKTDLRPYFEKYLIDSYSVGSPLEYNKVQVLATIDNTTVRLSHAYQSFLPVISR